MVLTMAVGVCFVVVSWAYHPERTAPEPSWTTQAVVTRVIDGDTLDVEIRRTIRVRLLDCWSPESRIDSRLPEAERAAAKVAGNAAKSHLADLATGRAVILQIPLGTDGNTSHIMTLGRVLGNVWLVDDQAETLSEKQIKAGHATLRPRAK